MLAQTIKEKNKKAPKQTIIVEVFFVLKSILVFFGGQSVEHEVSVITGALTVNSIDTTKYKAIPVYVDNDGKWWTGEILKDVDSYKNLNYKKLTNVTLIAPDNKLYAVKGRWLKCLDPIACAINCMHGERGEDGSISGLLNMCNIPLASPSIFSSALSMSKTYTKIALKGLGVKTLPYISITDKEQLSQVENTLGYPLIVKPDSGGSSIGITVAHNKRELEQGFSYALRYGVRVIIEPYLTDYVEINCACYNSGKELVVSECEKPVSRGDILSYDDKYKDGAREFPANIDKKLSNKIQSITAKVYKSLGFEGIIRIDYMVCDGVVYLNEINSVPGSLAYYLFVNTLKDYSGLLNTLIANAITNGARQSTVTKKFSSGILTLTGSKGAKRLKK